MAVKVVPTFQKLRLAEYDETKPNEFDYKGGSHYVGLLVSNAKQGLGLFKWTNGDIYFGEFIDDRRNGRGAQKWSDGSSYEGDFVQDRRCGRGVQKWSTGECYEGEFYDDERHGHGIYNWPNGSNLEGLFSRGAAEGYCTLNRPGISTFEGLFKSNERLGPGVLSITNQSGETCLITQDVGLWNRESLMFLCSESQVNFSLQKFPEFKYDPVDYQLEITYQVENGRHARGAQLTTQTVQESATDFSAAPDANPAIASTTESTHSEKRSTQIKWKDQSSEHTDGGEDEDANFKTDAESGACPSPPAVQPTVMKFIAFNPSHLYIEMQKHAHQFEHTNWKYQTTLSIEQIVGGKRESFEPPGAIERDSLALINAAYEGDRQTVAALLKQGHIHANVADRRGITPLFAAAIGWNYEVINLLLDNGADVNALTNEHVSPISACVLQYYKMAETLSELEALGVDSSKERQAVRVTIKEPLLQRETSEETKRRGQTPPRRDVSVLKLAPPTRGYQQSQPKMQPLMETVESRLMSADQLERLWTAGSSNNLSIISDGFSEYDDAETLFAAKNGRNWNESDTSRLPSAEFASAASLVQYPIRLNDDLIERCANQLSANEQIMKRSRMLLADPKVLENEGTVRQLAIRKSGVHFCNQTVQLLLKRGADPNASNAPMPILFCAIKAADVSSVRLFLERGADPNAKLLPKMGGLTPLHCAAMLEGEAGPKIVEMLLLANADPNIRAFPDDSYAHLIEPQNALVDPSEDPPTVLEGRTALHIACERNHDFENAAKIARLLINHKAELNAVCNGHTPLTLTIFSGNDSAMEALLEAGADVNMSLTKGLVNANWVAVTLEVERCRKKLETRMEMLNTFVKFGADLLMLLPVGPRKLLGTVIDAAYYSYSLDKRISHIPFHALAAEERETYVNRQQFLAHLSTLVREQAVRQRERLVQMTQRKSGPSPSSLMELTDRGAALRKSTMRYCYECGRSAYVRLVACTRCGEVYFCSKQCKQKAWLARHKDECSRMDGKRGLRSSATPATYPERQVRKLPQKRDQPEVAMKGRSVSAPRDLKLPPIVPRNDETYTSIADKYYKLKITHNDAVLRKPNLENYSFT